MLFDEPTSALTRRSASTDVMVHLAHGTTMVVVTHEWVLPAKSVIVWCLWTAVKCWKKARQSSFLRSRGMSVYRRFSPKFSSEGASHGDGQRYA